MAAKFKVIGPVEIPTTIKRAGVSIIEKENIESFISKNKNLMGQKGCYIFTIRVTSGVLPFYVGKATKSFGQEIFHSHKMEKYNSSLLEYAAKYKPQMFFLVYNKTTKGKDNLRAISELEKFLIQLAESRNPKLKNEKNLKEEEKFEIEGLKAQGKPSREISAFKKVIGI